MGIYLNPGNEGFAGIVSGEYIDKTGIIPLVSEAIGTPRKLVCSTRPRRFGKTFAAESLVAYYSCGCDSHALFEGLDVSRHKSYEEHLNAYNLIRLDMTAFRNAQDVAKEVTRVLLPELRELCPGAGMGDEGCIGEITSALTDVVDATGRRFVFVIDEWDAPLRERRPRAAQEDWVFFLRLLFKNMTFTTKVVAAAYMTGILPVVRYGTQSALSDFREYTILHPYSLAPYVGLNDEEVKDLALRYNMDLCELQRWYDGYELPYYDSVTKAQKAVHAYAPFSVVNACENHAVGPYWTSSEAFETLRQYVDMDFDGLQQAIVQVVGGASVKVDIGTFENDMHDVSSSDDVLTLLCHLGYLVYDEQSSTARVPNEEVRAELGRALKRSRHQEVARIIRNSDALLAATWDMDEESVAQAIAAAHDDGCAPAFYNNEQALRAVVKSAYISAADHYARIEELPSGRGIADLVYVPKRGDDVPALVIELKWNRKRGAAMGQIRDRDYARVLRDWGGPTLLVGIAYDPKSKVHSCTIEEA